MSPSDTLRQVADLQESTGFSRVGPWPLLHIELKLGGCTLRVRCIARPDAIRARAVKLEKQIRRAPKAAPKQGAIRLRLSRREIEARAKQFVEDGEPENAKQLLLLAGGATMTASEQAKAAGFKSLSEVAEVIGETPQWLTKKAKQNPKLFRVILAGCKAVAKEDRPAVSHWWCASCGEALQERDVTLRQHHAFCGNPAKWVDVAD